MGYSPKIGCLEFMTGNVLFTQVRRYSLVQKKEITAKSSRPSKQLHITTFEEKLKSLMRKSSRKLLRRLNQASCLNRFLSSIDSIVEISQKCIIKLTS